MRARVCVRVRAWLGGAVAWASIDRLALPQNATHAVCLVPCRPSGMGLSRDAMTAGIENSLERLQTPCIDLHQIHCWDALVPCAD